MELPYVIKYLAADNTVLRTRRALETGLAATLGEVAENLPAECACVELGYSDACVIWRGPREKVERFAEALGDKRNPAR